MKNLKSELIYLVIASIGAYFVVKRYSGMSNRKIIPNAQNRASMGVRG